MRFARSLARPAKVGRKWGRSGAEVRQRPGSGCRSAPLFAGTPPSAQGASGPVLRLRRGPRRPCVLFLRVLQRFRHPCPVLRASLQRRVLFCELFSGSGIRALSCARLCGGVCFAAALSAVRAAGLQSLLCLLLCGSPVQRGADAAFFAPCGPRLRRVPRIDGPAFCLASAPGFVPRFGDPASRFASVAGVFAAPVGGRDRPVRFRPSPGPVRPPPVRRRTSAAGAASRPCRAFPGPAAGANRR